MSPTYFSHHRVVHKLYKRCHIRQMQCHLDSCHAVSMIHSHGVRVLLHTVEIYLVLGTQPTISARYLMKLKGVKLDDEYGHKTFRDSPCFAFVVLGALLLTASIMLSTRPLCVLSCSLSTKIPAVTTVTCHLLLHSFFPTFFYCLNDFPLHHFFVLHEFFFFSFTSFLSPLPTILTFHFRLMP